MGLRRRVYSVDFSTHELSVIKESEYTTTYVFKKPDTIYHSFKIVCTHGITLVTGDYGNWVFCREFHPSIDGYVSRGYFDEKLEINSVQNAKKYCSDETIKLIDEFERDYEYNFGEMTEEVSEWIGELREYVDDEVEYENIAYRNKPSNIDYEDVPYGKKRHVWLDMFYDGFNAICDKLGESVVYE